MKVHPITGQALPQKEPKFAFALKAHDDSRILKGGGKSLQNLKLPQ